MKNNFIKRMGALALIAALAISMVACGKPAEKPVETDPVQGTEAPVVEDTTPVVDESSPADVETDVTEPADEVISAADSIAAVLIDTYDEAYLATQMMDASMIEMMYGITADMYDDCFAAMPMMMGHVVEVVMLHATYVAPLLEKLNARKDALANDMFQYPANLPRLAAIDVVDFENGWVGLFILGGQADIALQEEWGEDTDKAVTYYTEQNKKGIDALKQYFVDGIVPEVDVYTVIMPPYVEEDIVIDEGIIDELADAVEGAADAVVDVVDDVVDEATDTTEAQG